MSNKTLEKYLEDLFTALAPLSVSERSEIVTEIKSHILSKLESDEGKSLKDVLDEIGEPKTLAAVYREERGMPSDKDCDDTDDTDDDHDSVDPVKMAQDLISRMVDIEDDHVRLFGGLIDIDSKRGRLKIGDLFTFDGKSHVETASRALGKHQYRGKHNVSEDEDRTLLIRWNVGKVDVVVHDSNEISWKWKGIGASEHEVLLLEGDEIVLDLSHYGPGKGTIYVPNSLPLQIEAEVGKLHLHNPTRDTVVKISVGKVEILAHPLREYRWNLRVDMGRVDAPESSKNPAAPEITVAVNTGKISVGKSDYCS